jgi:Putative Zn-dependent protease, contains TPR repeats
MPGREAWAKEMELAQKALELRSESRRSTPVHGNSSLQRARPHASEKELDRAVELNPNLALIYDQYGWTFSATGSVRRRVRGRKEGAGTRPAKHFSEHGLRLFFFTGRAVLRRQQRKSARPWN